MEQIARQDAAYRQLHAAIWMYAEERDPVIVHTVAAAALQIYSDMLREEGKQGAWDLKIWMDFFKDETLAKAARHTLRAPQNFFKHGTIDEELTYHPGSVSMIIYSACLAHLELGGPQSSEVKIYTTVFEMKHPEVWKKGSLERHQSKLYRRMFRKYLTQRGLWGLLMQADDLGFTIPEEE